MGATYYVDPAASGANNGSTWTNAWTSVQSAFDAADAGDLVYCRGTQVLAASIDVDTNAGNVANGTPIRFVGCNAAGANDGTRFVLNGNATAAYCLNAAEKAGYIIENFEATGATADGFGCSAATPDYWTFLNCYAHDNGGNGWADASHYFAYGLFIGCRAHGNGASGFANLYLGVAVGCDADDNTLYGFAGYGMTCIGCAVWGNTNDGFRATSNYPVVLWQCAVDDNSDGMDLRGLSAVLASRITASGSVGLRSAGTVLGLWNYLRNTSDTSVPALLNTFKGVDTTLTGTGAADDGYEGAASGLLNAVPGAMGMRTSIALQGGSLLQFARGLPTIPKRPVGRMPIHA